MGTLGCTRQVPATAPSLRGAEALKVQQGGAGLSLDMTLALSVSPSPIPGSPPVGRKSALWAPRGSLCLGLSTRSSPSLGHVEECPGSGSALSSLEKSSFVHRLGIPRAI